MKMILFKEYTPSLYDEPLIVRLETGIRYAILSSRNFNFMFTDCTHPMQQAYLQSNKILEWEYVDEEKMKQLLFSKNTTNN